MSTSQISFISICINLMITISCSSCYKISNKSQTVSAMTETAKRIQIYISKHGKIPSTLKELPVRDGYSNRIIDAWDRELLFEVINDEFKLKSLGKDGKIGGLQDNGDIIRIYQQSSDGSWLMQEQ